MDSSNKGMKPKTVATIDVNLHWSKIEKKDWLAETLDDHFHCIFKVFTASSQLIRHFIGAAEFRPR